MAGQLPLAAFCLLTTLLASGGVVNGWGPLHSNLDASTALSEAQLQLANDLAGIALSVGSLVFGVAIDHCGVRCVAVAGLLLAVIGNVLLALGSTAATVTVGFSFVTGGGIGPYLATMALANMEKDHTPMLVALNSAMFNLSGFNYCVLDWLHGASATAVRRSFFLGYAVLAAGLALGALALLPRPRRRSAEPLLGSEGDALASTATTLWQEARSPPLAATALFFAVSQLVGTWLGGALPDLCTQKGQRAGVSAATYKGRYVDVLLPILTSAPALLCNPLAGAFVARHSAGASFALANTLAAATLALALLPNLEVQVVTFVVSTARNAVLFTVFFTFLSEGSRAPHYGSLVAVCTGLASVLGLGVVPIIELSGKRYVPILWGCLVVTLLCFAQPALLLAHDRQAQRAISDEDSKDVHGTKPLQDDTDKECANS